MGVKENLNHLFNCFLIFLAWLTFEFYSLVIYVGLVPVFIGLKRMTYVPKYYASRATCWAGAILILISSIICFYGMIHYLEESVYIIAACLGFAGAGTLFIGGVEIKDLITDP